jgi:hypothetical protein
MFIFVWYSLMYVYTFLLQVVLAYVYIAVVRHLTK